MKICSIQNKPSIGFTGLIKTNKKIPTFSIVNPTPEDLKKIDERSKKQLEELGLTLIKKVTLHVKNISQSKK